MKEGGNVYDGPLLLNEVLDLFVEIEDASKSDAILEKNADPKMLDWMINENFGGTKPVLDWNYCYGMRLRNFNGVNQIDRIITKLKQNPDAKSATVSLMDPSVDFDDHMACIVALDFKIRNGNKLYLTAFFRSQDIGKKFYADILALGAIQDEVAQGIGIAKGSVKIFISSAHIYETEFDKVNNFIKDVYMKDITIITGNQNKFNEYKRYLAESGSAIQLSKVGVDIPEIQSLDHKEILTKKIEAVSQKVSGCFIVDDVCFYTERYPNFPGPYAKFINSALGLAGWESLFEEGDAISAVATLGLYTETGIQFFEGKIEGILSFKNKDNINSEAPINSIFYVPEERGFLGNLIGKVGFRNHRRIAFEKLLLAIDK